MYESAAPLPFLSLPLHTSGPLVSFIVRAFEALPLPLLLPRCIHLRARRPFIARGGWFTSLSFSLLLLLPSPHPSSSSFYFIFLLSAFFRVASCSRRVGSGPVLLAPTIQADHEIDASIPY